MRLAAYLACMFASLTVITIDRAEAVGLASCEQGRRLVNFKIEEGTQLSIDASPDGQWLVFDMLGDIFLLPVRGGQARMLTNGGAWDARPVWSPDGKRIAFISDRSGADQVFVVDAADGENIRQVTYLTRDQKREFHTVEGEIRTVEWMPDSQHIVTVGRRIDVDAIDTQNGAISAEFPNNSYFGNGKALYVFRERAYEDLPARKDDNRTPYTVWKMHDHSAPEHIVGLDRNLFNGWSVPAVSRNGRWMIYRDRAPREEAMRMLPVHTPKPYEMHMDSIRIYDMHTALDRVLVGPTISPGWRSNGFDVFGNKIFPYNNRYAISPDSRFLYLNYGGKIHQVDLESGQDLQIPMVVDVDQCLAPIIRNRLNVEEGSIHVKNLANVTRSPDDKQLLFSAMRHLYVADESGSDPRVIRKQAVGQFEPAYSPDGKWIAYVTWDDTKGGHVWRMKADGSNLQQLTDVFGYYQFPTWSPDGQAIAFAGSTDLSFKRHGFDSRVYAGDLYTISLRDMVLRKLSQRVRQGSPLSFSGNGKVIYFRLHEVDLRFMHLASVEVDGKGIEKLQSVDHLFPHSGPASAIVNPGESALAMEKDGNVYLLDCTAAAVRGDFASAKCREIQVTREGGGDPRWRLDGTELEWSFANTYYRAKLEDLLHIRQPASAESAAVDTLAASNQLQADKISLVVARPVPTGAIALTGARVITMRDKEVIEEGTVVVRNGRIESVGPVGQVKIPEDAQVFNVEGKTVIPGFIDAHAHQNEVPRDLLAGNHWQPLVNLSFGITTQKNPSNGGDHVYSYAELVEAGDMVGPRLYSATALGPDLGGSIGSLADALNIVARYKRLGAPLIKYHTGFNRTERGWIFEAARLSGVDLVSHLPAQSYLFGWPNLSTIYDGATSSEHEITEDGDLFGDVKNFILQSGVSINFASLASSGGYNSEYWDSIKTDPRMQTFYRDDWKPKSKGNPGLLAKAELSVLRPWAQSNSEFMAGISRGGGRVTIGSHGDMNGIGMHLEMWAHVRGGMSSHQVLRAATLNGAWSLGLEDDLGSLEVGKVADILVLSKNPLEDIRNTISVETVIKGGLVREADTLAEVWPLSKPLPKWEMGGIRKQITADDNTQH